MTQHAELATQQPVHREVPTVREAAHAPVLKRADVVRMQAQEIKRQRAAARHARVSAIGRSVNEGIQRVDHAIGKKILAVGKLISRPFQLTPEELQQMGGDINVPAGPNDHKGQKRYRKELAGMGDEYALTALAKAHKASKPPKQAR